MTARAPVERAFAILEPLCVTEEQKQSLFVLSAALHAPRSATPDQRRGEPTLTTKKPRRLPHAAS